MKYTLEQIHNLKDSELCEAISETREQKPTDKPPFFDMLGESKLGAWDYSYVNHIWRPLSWLDPQNWTRLMDEISNVKLSRFGIGNVWFISADTWEGFDHLSMEIFTNSPGRSVCEAWLFLYAQI
jgi:hypothetical protein